MRYAVTGGGKRVRPLLVYAAGQSLGRPWNTWMQPPAQWNCSMPTRWSTMTCRRWTTTTCAVVAPPSIAPSTKPPPSSLAMRCRRWPSTRSPTGSTAACRRPPSWPVPGAGAGRRHHRHGGRPGAGPGTGRRAPDLETLQQMHQLKTGALITAAVRLGMLAAGPVDAAHAGALERYARDLGLAFQIRTTSWMKPAITPSPARRSAPTASAASRPTPRCSASSRRGRAPRPCSPPPWMLWPACRATPAC